MEDITGLNHEPKLRIFIEDGRRAFRKLLKVYREGKAKRTPARGVK